MIVFLRLVKCLIVSAFSPAVDPLGQATVRMRVWPNDLDLNVHATSGRYLTFMDIGRMALLVRMGMARKVLARKWRPIVGGAMITYRKSLLPFEAFVVRSRVLCWDEKWFYFEHIIERRDGEVSAAATVRGLLRGPEGNVAPSELIALSGRTIDPPPIPDFISRWSEAEKRA